MIDYDLFGLPSPANEKVAAAGGRHNIHEQFDNIVLIGNVIKNVPPAKIRSLVVREPSKLVEELLSSFFYFPC